MDVYKKIQDIIEGQFLQVMSADPNYYGQYEVILSFERQYVKEAKRDSKNIYIVIKTKEGPLNHGQKLISINFNAMAEGNKGIVCQRLLLEYAEMFNLCPAITVSQQESGDGSSYLIKQVYTMPQVNSNFNESWNEFRSLMFMSGTFLVGRDSMPIESITYYDSASDEVGHEVDFLNATWDFTVQLDSQAFYSNGGITQSKSRLGTLTLGLIMYITNTPLCNKVMGMAWRMASLAQNGLQESFYLTVRFANGLVAEKMEFKLAHGGSQQNLGEFPLGSFFFTN